MDRQPPVRPLLETVEQLTMILDTTGLGLWDLRPQTSVLFISDRCFTMAGYVPGEFPSTVNTMRRLIHPEDIGDAIREMTKIVRGECTTISIQCRFRKKNGDWMWILSRGRICEWDPEGMPLRIIGTHMDIDDWMKADIEKRQYQKQFEYLVENANTGIFIAQDGLIRYANAGIERISGYTRDELVGKPFTRIIHEADRALVAKRHSQRLKGENCPDCYSIHGIHKTGEEIWIELNTKVIQWEGYPAVLVFVRDVTADKAMVRQQLQSQKMQAIGTLAGGIAHDFNNILSSVIGYTEIALDDELPPDAPARESLENVLKASFRAKELVKQILTFSRQTDVQKEPINIVPIAKEVLKLIRASLPSNIQIRENIPLDRYDILADPSQIHQVILNLCANAGHAMMQNGGILCLGITEIIYNDSDPQLPVDLEPGLYAALTVSDTGIGMSSEIMDRVFNPFFTTKTKGEGTGLGMSVVHGIVREHQGAIWFDSSPGEGTTFRVYFPIIEHHPQCHATSEEDLPRGSERILVVDDEVEIGRAIKKKFEILGYTVTALSSSLDALNMFIDNPDGYDLVITDLTMPEMTGDQLALKILEIRPDIPIILCTGFSPSINEAQAGQVGISEFLMKPFESRVWTSTVRRVLDREQDE